MILQTPVHEIHNASLLKLLPTNALKLIEIGCSSGALAREFKKSNSICHYIGVEIENNYLELAKRYCDSTICANLEEVGDDFYQKYADCDCWIFGDVLEHMRDPWTVLRKIRKVIPVNGVIVASIPNVQHWSVFAKLSAGDFRYVDSGLFDRTHLRWFTRVTIMEMFNQAGFSIVEGGPIVQPESEPRKYTPLIGAMASFSNHNAQIAMNDAQAFQFVVKAVPV